jgi:hypothetical protein
MRSRWGVRAESCERGDCTIRAKKIVNWITLSAQMFRGVRAPPGPSPTPGVAAAATTSVDCCNSAAYPLPLPMCDIHPSAATGKAVAARATERRGGLACALSDNDDIALSQAPANGLWCAGGSAHGRLMKARGGGARFVVKRHPPPRRRRAGPAHEQVQGGSAGQQLEDAIRRTGTRRRFTEA